MYACARGHKNVAKLIMDNTDNNIDLNKMDERGRTAYMLACRKGHRDVVQLLLEYSQDKGILISKAEKNMVHKDIRDLIEMYLDQ